MSCAPASLGGAYPWTHATAVSDQNGEPTDLLQTDCFVVYCSRGILHGWLDMMGDETHGCHLEGELTIDGSELRLRDRFTDRVMMLSVTEPEIRLGTFVDEDDPDRCSRMTCGSRMAWHMAEGVSPRTGRVGLDSITGT
jgi:hypothetical protein